MLLEREVRGKIAVTIPVPVPDGSGRNQRISIEPDASLPFLLQGKWHHFFHIEVYRNLPTMEQQFKQKIQGYVVYAQSPQHQQLFQTSALSIAVFTATEQMAKILKRWTEEALAKQPDDGSRFYFTSVNPATASPAELFLTPVWQQACEDNPIPLLVLDEGDGEVQANQ
jgi:hypothetical protein